MKRLSFEEFFNSDEYEYSENWTTALFKYFHANDEYMDAQDKRIAELVEAALIVAHHPEDLNDSAIYMKGTIRKALERIRRGE